MSAISCRVCFDLSSAKDSQKGRNVEYFLGYKYHMTVDPA